jgi:aminoglycoside phosphotransferase (APT) family kinase protein
VSRPGLDSPVAIRSGEELDLGALQKFLPSRLHLPIASISARQFPGGFSNLTYLVTTDDHDYVLRRPPFGARAKTAHDMGREFQILTALAPSCPWAPPPILYCEDESVLGAPFYLMERVEGVILRSDASTVDAPDEAEMKAASLALVDALVDLHGVDLKAVGLQDFGKRHT